jgi:hypothetical protein
MRIGTWNLDGRWSADHRRFLKEEECDIWLLTEVPTAFSLDDGALFPSTPMATAKAWAAVWSTGDVVESSSPHPAAATAVRDGFLLCSCVLPWRAARVFWPEDTGDDIAAITTAALARLETGLLAAARPVVWGGDWNHALHGREDVGTNDGRRAIGKVLAAIGLQVPTENLPNATPGMLSIDHIAIPTEWHVGDCRRVVAGADGKRLSDHDAYIVDCTTRAGWS